MEIDTEQLSLRAQTILDFIESALRDLALELHRDDYEEVHIRLSVSAE